VKIGSRVVEVKGEGFQNTVLGETGHVLIGASERRESSLGIVEKIPARASQSRRSNGGKGD